MAVFVDTSAFLSLLNADDLDHAAVDAAWMQLVGRGEALVTHNYVVVESCALTANRLGMDALRGLVEQVLPLVTVAWVDPLLHEAALSAQLTANRRRLSLVDCVSFAVMRQRGLDTALTLDGHFREQGFACLP